MKTHVHHHGECKHQRLAFCQKCQVPHCLDCGKEWRELSVTYYPYYPNTSPTWYSTTTPLTSDTISATSGYCQVASCDHSS